VDEKRENRLLCPPADSQPESLGSKRSVPRTHPEHSLTLMGDSTTKSAAVMTTLSFSYTTVLLIRLCGIRYSQLSARDSMPSAMTAEDTGALRQRQNRIMKPMALQRSSVPARSPMPLLSPVPMAVKLRSTSRCPTRRTSAIWCSSVLRRPGFLTTNGFSCFKGRRCSPTKSRT